MPVHPHPFHPIEKNLRFVLAHPLVLIRKASAETQRENIRWTTILNLLEFYIRNLFKTESDLKKVYQKIVIALNFKEEILFKYIRDKKK